MSGKHKKAALNALIGAIGAFLISSLFGRTLRQSAGTVIGIAIGLGLAVYLIDEL